jgi:hypothetical protein
MRRRCWGWSSVVGLLLLAGVLGGCDGDDHDDDHHGGAGCFLVGEREPNATPLTAQFLSDLFVDDCVIVDGSLFDAGDVDSYRVFVQETLTLVVTVDHSPFVDFDVQLFDADTGALILDCGINVAPERCLVPFVVRGFTIAVDVVVTSFIGAGTYTLTLDAQ